MIKNLQYRLTEAQANLNAMMVSLQALNENLTHAINLAAKIAQAEEEARLRE